jgi:ribosomal protein S18 acetylase RimI-like enzyme
MSSPITYSESLESLDAADLEGFLAHWDFTPPANTLLRMLKGSSVVILARDPESSQICGYVAALTDHVAFAYITAIEVRPEYRKRGIGTALLNRMTERLSVYGTYLSCAPALIPFYESAGFKRVAGMAKRRLPAADEV